LDIKAKLGFIPLLILDDGHGMETPGKRTPKFADGHFTHENEFNRAVIDLLEADALRLGFKTLQVAPGDNNVPLQTRTDKANAAHAAYKKQLGSALIGGKPISLFISEHYNAILNTFEGNSAEGVETFCFKFGGESELLARLIHKHILRGTVQKNRGVKMGDLHVLRETNMPAVLIEAGFMDDPREAVLMTSAAFQLETATQILMGVCEFYGLVYEVKPEVEPTNQERAVDAALAARLITDRVYWLKVLNGEIPVSLTNLTKAFTNAKGLRRG